MILRTPLVQVALLLLTAAGCNNNPLGGNPDAGGPPDFAGLDLTGVDLTVITPGVPQNHRPTADTCPVARPAYNCNLGGPDGFVQPWECGQDTMCTTGDNGRCVGNGHDGCHCSYDTCKSDADCQSGELCSCRAAWHYGANGPNVCMPTNCRVDLDCGPVGVGFCSPSLDPGCGTFSGVTLWHCHTAQDTCLNDSDCSQLDGGWGPPFCGWRPELGHWACSLTQCVG